MNMSPDEVLLTFAKANFFPLYAGDFFCDGGVCSYASNSSMLAAFIHATCPPVIFMI